MVITAESDSSGIQILSSSYLCLCDLYMYFLHAVPGRSGVRVGIASAGDPVWTGFGDMYANWQFTSLSDPSSTMDVRG